MEIFRDKIRLNQFKGSKDKPKRKFVLTDDCIKKHGVKLYRIKCIESFGPVKKGEYGGYVEGEYNLSKWGLAWVYGDACVFGNVKLLGNAKVYGSACVYGNAIVCDDACVSDYAIIGDCAKVYGSACVSDKAKVYGNAKVCGYKWLSGYDSISGDESLDNITKNHDYNCLVTGNKNINECPIKDKIEIMCDRFCRVEPEVLRRKRQEEIEETKRIFQGFSDIIKKRFGLDG